MNKGLINEAAKNIGFFMINMNTKSDFRKYLQEELVRRSQNDPRYSLRAFARHLEVDSSFLSKILNGKRTVTARTIRMFGERLNLASEELQLFEKGSRERKMQKKLERLLEDMPNDEREQSTLSLTVDESRLPEAKEKIKALRKELAQILGSGAPAGKAYQISVSLFPLYGP